MLWFTCTVTTLHESSARNITLTPYPPEGPNPPEVSDEVAEDGATRCPVNPRAAGPATHAEHPAHPASTAAAVAAFLLGAIS